MNHSILSMVLRLQEHNSPSFAVSAACKFLLIGINSLENGRAYNSSLNSQLNKSGVDFDSETEETDENNRTDLPSPSICFLDMHTLEVSHVLRLGEGQDITALTLNQDNTNLLVSTLDKQLIIFTDPSLSLKVVDQMLKLGWEGNGLQPLIKS